MRFIKMQGLGNDFVIIDGFAYADLGDVCSLAKRMCDRHFGVGADGLIWITPSPRADARMRIFNADGTEAETCGNGLRCTAKFMRDTGIAKSDEMRIDTLAGVAIARIEGGLVSVDMGAPRLKPREIPVDAPDNRVEIEAGGRKLNFFCVSMGNPHAVTFDLYPEGEEFYRLGALLEKHPIFPRRANIEFCRIANGEIDVRVWERGDGETLACGSGACAALVAAAEMGLAERAATVRLPGGKLQIRWREDGRLALRGPAEIAFTGDWRRAL